jgi:hypothetical protein
MMWTQFMDMHSGGPAKEPQQYIYIEAPEEEAKVIFYNRFGHNPERVTCTHCGDDYSITESETLEQATAYERGCAWSEDSNKYEERQADRFPFNKCCPLDEYLKTDILVIRDNEISPEERTGDVPLQGYVWQD